MAITFKALLSTITYGIIIGMTVFTISCPGSPEGTKDTKEVQEP